MALFDCGLIISVHYGLDALVTKKDPERFGNQRPSIVPYGVFEAQDGPLIIAVGNSMQFERFCNEVLTCWPMSASAPTLSVSRIVQHWFPSFVARSTTAHGPHCSSA